ncbi:MAG: hypothetical protein Q8J76_09030 [Desulfobulbaceae bacterium]|nr:hypothetical protein [Desulfobulbaceae bacterium]
MKNEIVKNQEAPFLNADDLPDGLISGVIETLCLPDDPLVELEVPNLVRLTLGSLSLCIVEKNRVFEQMPDLSFFQVNELLKVFEAERKEYLALFPTERRRILLLSAISVIGAFSLAICRGRGYPDPKEEENMVRQMSVDKAARVPELRSCLKKYDEDCYGVWDIAVRFVYGAVLSEKRKTDKKKSIGRCAIGATIAVEF